MSVTWEVMIGYSGAHHSSEAREIQSNPDEWMVVVCVFFFTPG
jgi:hypothetical protein